MPNPYYSFTPPAITGDFIQAPNWNNEFQDVQAAFDSVKAVFDQLPAFSGGAFTETFSILPAVLPAHPVRFDQFLSWGQDVSANGYKLTGLSSPSAAGDAVNLSTLQATDAATRAWVVQVYFSGITPASVPVISFQADAAKPGQAVVVNAAGTALEYRPLPNITRFERAERRARMAFIGA